MKKKYLTIILIIVVLIVCWLTIFFIDFSRCNSLKMPIFVFSTNTADDGGSGTYYGIGYKVIVKKYISSEYGVQIESLEMHFLGRVISASISDKTFTKDVKSFVGTVIEETNNHIIVRPNENEDERKSSDRIIINYNEANIESVLGVGSKVIVKYVGGIMESYPAQINVEDIIKIEKNI